MESQDTSTICRDIEQDATMRSIDILLATYNGEKYLVEQIESLFTQTCNDFRVIARDDGSRDSTAAILRRYHEQYGDRFIVIEDDQPTGSAKGNFARLLECSDAPYAMFCDQDDYWHNDKIEATFSAMRTAEAEYPGAPVLVHSDLRVVDAGRHPIAPSFWKYQGINPYSGRNRLLVQNCITGCTVMINRNLRRLAAPIPEKVMMHDWWLALVAGYLGRVVVVEEPLIDYRQHEANDTGAKHYSFERIIKRAKSILIKTKKVKLEDFDEVMARLRQQAQMLLEAYGHAMSASDRRAVGEFLMMERYNYIRRLYVVMRYGFTINGTIRNMAYIISI